MTLAALRRDKTRTEIAAHDDFHPNQVTAWKRQLQERAGAVLDSDAAAGKSGNVLDVFEGTAREDRAAGAGNRFLKQRTHQGGIVERNEMIDRTHALPVAAQCQPCR